MRECENNALPWNLHQTGGKQSQQKDMGREKGWDQWTESPCEIEELLELETR